MKKIILLLLLFLNFSTLFAKGSIFIHKDMETNVKLIKEELHSAYMFTISPFGILDKKRSAFMNENHLKELPKLLIISLTITLSILLIAFAHYKFQLIDKIINLAFIIYIFFKLISIFTFVSFIVWLFGAL